MITTRYRLKILVPPIGGIAGQVLRLFPNALTFVGYPSVAQMEFIQSSSALLGAFGVSISIEASA